MAPGAAALAKSNQPLVDGFRTIFGSGAATRLLALLACTGLIASFHTIIFDYGRQIFSLSRSGYFPTWLSETNSRRQTPQRALIAGAVVGLLVVAAIQFSPQGGAVGAVLLNMAVFGAVLAYVLQMVSFVALRVRFAGMKRPYRSPLGTAGAIVAAAVAIATLITLFASPDYNKGVIGAAAWFILGIAYYVFYARRRLVLAPEEASAAAHEKESGV
jgi:ethanolamine permease